MFFLNRDIKILNDFLIQINMKYLKILVIQMTLHTAKFISHALNWRFLLIGDTREEFR